MEERPLILITGANGQLGQAFRNKASEFTDMDILFMDRSQLDITKAKRCRKVLEEILPDVVINCAAYTNVEKAEEEPDLATQQNGTAPAFLAVACSLTGARLIHFSTDYVFDGTKSTAYLESDATVPISAYGESKRAGERGIVSAGGDFWIFRISWLYSPFGHNFYKTMLRFGKEKPELKVVADQFGTPTNASILAKDMLLLCRKALFDDHFDLPHGIYHYAHKGKTTWHGFASAILKKYAIETPVIPVTTDAFPTKAKRPEFSLLDASLFFKYSAIEQIEWDTALDLCIKLHNELDPTKS